MTKEILDPFLGFATLSEKTNNLSDVFNIPFVYLINHILENGQSGSLTFANNLRGVDCWEVKKVKNELYFGNCNAIFAVRIINHHIENSGCVCRIGNDVYGFYLYPDISVKVLLIQELKDSFSYDSDSGATLVLNPNDNFCSINLD